MILNSIYFINFFELYFISKLIMLYYYIYATVGIMSAFSSSEKKPEKEGLFGFGNKK